MTFEKSIRDARLYKLYRHVSLAPGDGWVGCQTRKLFAETPQEIQHNIRFPDEYYLTQHKKLIRQPSSTCTVAAQRMQRRTHGTGKDQQNSPCHLHHNFTSAREKTLYVQKNPRTAEVTICIIPERYCSINSRQLAELLKASENDKWEKKKTLWCLLSLHVSTWCVQ